ncbi:MAG: hypothetical protein R3C02_19635 [Planctomycetaceae bacterium]
MGEIRRVSIFIFAASLSTGGFNCFDHWIPVQNNLVVLKVTSGIVSLWVWFGDRRNWAKSAEGITEFSADTVDGLLQPDHLERLLAEILDDRQQELLAIVIDRQSLFLKVLAEFRHVISANAEDVQRLQRADIFWAIDAVGKLSLPAAFQADVVTFQANASPRRLRVRPKRRPDLARFKDGPETRNFGIEIFEPHTRRRNARAGKEKAV